MTKKNSKPRTLEDRNPLAQSTFAAQCNHAQITGKMEIVPAKTLAGRAFVFIIVVLAAVGILSTLILGAM